MNNLPVRQRGLSLVGWLLIILVVGSVATLGIRLVPHYLEHRALVGIVNALPADQVHRMSQGEIREALQRRFTVNNIRDRNPGDVIRIERSRERTALVLEYEIREHLVGNIDLVISFHEQVDFQ